MTTSENSSSQTPAGWYPYGSSGESRWWDGSQWHEPASAEKLAEDEARRGKLLLEINQTYNLGSLRVYENEVWKIMQPGYGSSMGGTLVGARAEVKVQSVMKAGVVVRRLQTEATTLLYVSAPDYEFSFSVPFNRATAKAVRVQQLNWAADHVNNRSRVLEGEKEPETPSAGPGHSVADELAKFAALRDQGILTEEEFAAKKAQLLS